MSAAPLWTVAEVARALGLSGEFPNTPIEFVTQDSRLVKPGSLFVALSGTPSGGGDLGGFGLLIAGALLVMFHAQRKSEPTPCTRLPWPGTIPGSHNQLANSNRAQIDTASSTACCCAMR